MPIFKNTIETVTYLLVAICGLDACCWKNYITLTVILMGKTIPSLMSYINDKKKNKSYSSNSFDGIYQYHISYSRKKFNLCSENLSKKFIFYAITYYLRKNKKKKKNCFCALFPTIKKMNENFSSTRNFKQLSHLSRSMNQINTDA